MVALFLSSRSKRHETDKANSAKGMICMVISVICMVISVISGAASALYDKHILKQLEPLFVQSWTNVYITLLLAAILLFRYLTDREHFEPFVWDWKILLIAVLITAADMIYFFAMKPEPLKLKGKPYCCI